jgi:hypothetical protein
VAKRLLFVLMVFVVSATFARNNGDHTYYRSFLLPEFHGVRLAWCYDGGKQCGKSTADIYCQMMGYDTSIARHIDNDIGEAIYLANEKLCEHWNCDGFKKIKCVKKAKHKPAKSYHYRKRIFYFPRYDKYRVDWCNTSKHNSCGLKVANSFCKRIGYMRSKGFKKEQHVAKTRTLGSQALCLGDMCNGFKYIICYR